MGGGGRALNVDARPFNVPNVYQGGQGQVQGQVQTQGRDYNNHGQGPGRGHMQYDPQHQGGGMGNQNGYNNIGNYGYAQQQQQQPFVPYSASNGNPAGSNIYNQSGRTESYPPAQSVGGSGGGVGQVAVDSQHGGESNSNSNSSQQKNSDPSASS